MANPAADFPADLHEPTDISAFAEDALGATNPDHTEVHGKIEEEVEELGRKLGTGASTPTTAGHVLTVTGAGATEYAAPDTSPAITDFSGAQHDHADADDGGQLTDAALSAPVSIAKGGTDADTAAEARDNLGLEIGVDVQPYSANLAEYAAVNPTTAGLALLDDADAAAQRTTLEIDKLALADYNRVNNPFFDSWQGGVLNGWANANVTIVKLSHTAAIPFTGPFAVRLTPTAQFAGLEQSLPATNPFFGSGESFVLTIRYRVTVADAGLDVTVLRLGDFVPIAQETLDQSAWTTLEIPFTVPVGQGHENAKNYALKVESVSAAAWGTVEVDWIAITKAVIPSGRLPVSLHGNSNNLPRDLSAAYTVTNVTTDRTYDANATSDAEIADVLGTLIADLQAKNIIG